MGTPKPREVSWGVEAFSSPPHPPDHTTCPPAPRPAWTLEGQQRPSGKSHSTSQLPPHSWDVFPGRAQPSAWCALRPRVWELVALRRPGRRAEPSRPGTSGGAVSEPSPPPVSGSRCPRSPGHVWPPRHLPIAQTGAPARPWTWREEAGSAVGGAGEQAKERRVGHVTGSGRLGPQPGRGLCRGEAPAGSPGPGDLGTWDLGTGQGRPEPTYGTSGQGPFSARGPHRDRGTCGLSRRGRGWGCVPAERADAAWPCARRGARGSPRPLSWP